MRICFLLLSFLLVQSPFVLCRLPETLRVASIQSEPFLFEVDSEAEGNEKYDGFIKDLMDQLTNKTNTKYEILIPEDEKYGYRNVSTGQWNGLVGMVLANKADLIAADLTVVERRRTVLDFTSHMFLKSHVTVLLKGYDEVGTAFDLFAPYSVLVWILFFVALILATLALWLAARVTPHEHWPHVFRNEFTLANSAWFLFSGFFRGSNYTPRALSTRFVSAGWWIFVVAFMVVYVFALRSFIDGTWNPQYKIGDTLSELVDDRDLKFAAYGEGTTRALLQSSQLANEREIYNRILRDNLFISGNEEGIEMLESEAPNSLGVILESLKAQEATRDTCGYYMVGRLAERDYSIATRKGSPYINDLSEAVSRLIEDGSLAELQEKWFTPEDMNCQPLMKGKPTGMGTTKGIDNMVWIFVFLLIMLLVALLLSLLELVCFVNKNENKEKKSSTIIQRLKKACICCGKKGSEEPDKSKSIETQT